ncbi:EamA family transporter [Flavobacterium turcicum]|uniref:EamA family transporter n=1 Tax=Flavobacterium turcicum TaxID=2764718 RepID=A0ABR7JHR7_9FLAO|nr:EamA family transporter [Flavobacterium turcicum]MBC5864046.1 EamA family transporter [Flavobacterium turcicum]NHL02812.1 EamA family transporter [Flavobacterium turcicum]
MGRNTYYAAAFSAFFIWGFFSFALKPLQDYPSLDILFYRVFFSVATMILINVLFRRKVVVQNWYYLRSLPLAERRNAIVMTLGGAVFLSSNWFIYIFVMNHVSVNAASLAYLICPILTTVFAYFLLKEQLSKWQWFAVFISFVSCLLLGYGHFSAIFYSLLTAATYAFYIISQRKNTAIDKFFGLTLQLSFTALILAPFYPTYSGAVPTEPLFYGCMALIVVFFTVIPLFLNLYALKGISSSAVGIMIYINPIINFLLAIFYYKEQVSFVQLFSYFLILVSIVVFNEKLLFVKKKSSLV